MKLATIKLNDLEVPGIVTAKGIVLIETINQYTNNNWAINLFEIIQTGQLEGIKQWYKEEGQRQLPQMTAIPFEEVEYGPLYRNPRKIWGIGHNYTDNPLELNLEHPHTEPVGFMKPDTSIIGYGDSIHLPEESDVVIAEAELGIIIGKKCKDISLEEAPDVVAGFTPVLDITAADIHQKNPRFLTRAKSFDTFFSFGPQLVTTDEVPEVLDLTVATSLNQEVYYRNVIYNMRYRPWYTVFFHSKVMTLLPGDIIMTGTPGAVVIRDGDIVECQISHFEKLRNSVVDEKVKYSPFTQKLKNEVLS